MGKKVPEVKHGQRRVEVVPIHFGHLRHDVSRQQNVALWLIWDCLSLWTGLIPVNIRSILSEAF